MLTQTKTKAVDQQPVLKCIGMDETAYLVYDYTVIGVEVVDHHKGMFHNSYRCIEWSP